MIFLVFLLSLSFLILPLFILCRRFSIMITTKKQMISLYKKCGSKMLTVNGPDRFLGIIALQCRRAMIITEIAPVARFIIHPWVADPSRSSQLVSCAILSSEISLVSDVRSGLSCADFFLLSLPCSCWRFGFSAMFHSILVMG